MKKIITSLFVIIAMSQAHSLNFEYKKVNDFDVLNSFKSVSEFEESYSSYVQNCLDNTGGGTGGVSCFIGSKLWDRELNIYYKKLGAILNNKENSLLKKSQRAWIKERDASVEFNSMILNRDYSEQGTMYSLMRAGAVDRMITPIIKERVLVLKRWHELLK